MSIYFFICYYSQIVIDIIILYKFSTVGFFQVYDIIATWRLIVWKNWNRKFKIFFRHFNILDILITLESHIFNNNIKNIFLNFFSHSLINIFIYL